MKHSGFMGEGLGAYGRSSQERHSSVSGVVKKTTEAWELFGLDFQSLLLKHAHIFKDWQCLALSLSVLLYHVSTCVFKCTCCFGVKNLDSVVTFFKVTDKGNLILEYLNFSITKLYRFAIENKNWKIAQGRFRGGRSDFFFLPNWQMVTEIKKTVWV